MRRQLIRYMGQPAEVACDRRCDKAWGIHSRPRAGAGTLDDEMLPDDQLGVAPEDPETYEGGVGKPGNAHTGKLNRWCVRECERSRMVRPGTPIDLPDLATRTTAWDRIHQDGSS